MQHFVIVGILIIIAAILTYLGIDAFGLAKHMNPVSASAQAVSIDWLWSWEIVAISFLFALIVVPMAYSLVVFRRKKGETGDGEHIEGNDRLEIAWTVAPLFLVIIFAYMGSYSLNEVTRQYPDAVNIKVKGQQFVWTFEYPEYGVFSNELHLPVDKPVLLKMESADVLHSFWVPEFRLKQDLVPGRVTEYRVTPSLEGTYQVRCAELCGMSHSYMTANVIVESQESYDAWLAEEARRAAESQTPEGQGELLYVKYGCVGCHSLDGSPRTGPSWLNLYESQVSLADGTTGFAEEGYLRESITDPNATIVEGYPSPSPMPQFSLTDEEVTNLIAFIKSLSQSLED